MKTAINIILLPAVIVWLVCSFVLPIIHLLGMFYNTIEILELKILILNIMSYATAIGIPTYVTKYILESGFRIKDFKEIINKPEEKKKGCSSCKRKK